MSEFIREAVSDRLRKTLEEIRGSGFDIVLRRGDEAGGFTEERISPADVKCWPVNAGLALPAPADPAAKPVHSSFSAAIKCPECEAESKPDLFGEFCSKACKKRAYMRRYWERRRAAKK